MRIIISNKNNNDNSIGPAPDRCINWDGEPHELSEDLKPPWINYLVGDIQ
jgi:hypothetical protein